MSKMIYVMNEPENCGECYVACPDANRWDAERRPDDCPLKPMPEYTKPDSKHRFDGDVAYAAGWNSCLEEIGGENNE